MSGIPFGAPLQRNEGRSSLRVFDHIPRLRELLPHGGWPGAIYAQVLIRNLKAAKERTEVPAHLDELRGGAVYYTIVGPQGSADVALVGTGKVIAGASPEAGNRLFFTDGEIGEWTGLEVRTPIWFQTEPREDFDAEGQPGAPRRARAAQDREGDARVQGAHAPQRQRQRPRRAVAQAGHRDRDERSGALSEKELARRKAASERMKAIHAARKAGV